MMQEIKTQIFINAPIEKVWQVFMDFEKYGEWNPFVKRIIGNPDEGNKIEAYIQPEGQKGMTFKPKVLISRKEEQFRWKGNLLFDGLFAGEHYFKFERKDGGTEFIHGEEFSGLASNFILKKIGKSTKRGFESMNEALKKRVETKP